MLDKIKSFLKLQSIQDELLDNNLEEVYRLWTRQGGDTKDLTTFFIMNNIDPLNYMSFVYEAMYKNLNCKNLDLSQYSIDMIGSQAFENNTSLRNLNLGNVKYIGTVAFSGCTSLENFTITSSVDSIDEDAFSYCLLQELHIPKTVRRLGIKCFAHNPVRKVTTEHSMYDFKKVCNNAVDYVFFNCNNLDEIECSDGTITIHH